MDNQQTVCAESPTPFNITINNITDPGVSRVRHQASLANKKLASPSITPLFYSLK